ncbi:hypothetical protein OG709_34220 [Streptomyces sp. NBC_01267]|uniref:hypothetical protein n=1 Tax=unclassified Streptomyces TaxID=2593676 RepID=UPI002023D72A|nr:MULTISPECIES: hypothetical protein [unclassified Streptomyces]WSC18270.1 hypothetical protein OIE60_00680 [Streptomyces sp. NBC_01766]WSV52312.1 hypothetical protein OG282_00740 [Streptomyces sp. NBC_01014]
MKAEYTQKVASDLAANQSEQDRVRAELSRLQEELVQLEDSGQVLVKMQNLLETSAGTVTAAGKKSAKVPGARSPKSKDAGKKAGRSSKTAAEPARRGAARAKKAAPAQGANQPTWIELINTYLAGQNEPKSSTEIAAGVAEAHPQRGIQVTVVRNTLEQGVARGLIERSKQGRNVYYQAAPTGAGTADSDKAATA